MYTRRKIRLGVVISDKMQKTVVVTVETHKRHALYNKTMRRTTRYKAHDEQEIAKVGDTVRIIESRPISREKRWRVVEIVSRREVAELDPREIDAAVIGSDRLHTEVHTAAAPVAPAEAPAAKKAPAVAKAEAPVVEEAPAAEETIAEAAPAEPESEPETIAEQQEEQTEE